MTTALPTPTTSKKEILAQILRKKRMRDDLSYFAEQVVPRYVDAEIDGVAVIPKPAPHHKLLLHRLEQVAKGEIKRLLIFMPPGSAKSTYASKIFPAWLMARKPTKVIGASNKSTLAEEFSAEVQELITDTKDDLGVGLRKGYESVGWWKCSNGSEYVAAGCTSGIQGIRADLAIVDDPVKSSAEVASEKQRDDIWQWFKTDLKIRLKPGAARILIMTRWHMDDIGGRILATDADRVAKGLEPLWTVISLPAIWDHEEKEPSFPNGLGRQTGELLWPDWQTEDFINDMLEENGARDFASLFQQNPRPAEGSLIDVKKLEANKVDADKVKSAKKITLAYDLAATEKTQSNNPDYTVGMTIQRDEDGGFTILHMDRYRGGPDTVRANIVKRAEALAETFGAGGFTISVPQDMAAGGKWMVNDITKALVGYNVESSPEIGNKVGRASPFVAQVNLGNVRMVKASWNEPLLDEMSIWPGGKHDDIVDACGRAFSCLVDLPVHRRRSTWSSGNYSSR